MTTYNMYKKIFTLATCMALTTACSTIAMHPHSKPPRDTLTFPFNSTAANVLYQVGAVVGVTAGGACAIALIANNHNTAPANRRLNDFGKYFVFLSGAVVGLLLGAGIGFACGNMVETRNTPKTN